MAAKKIGAKIVIDGEQEFRAALNQSKTALKEFDSEMKLVTAQFKNNEKSMESLKQKQAIYQKQQAELTKQSKLLVEQIKKADEAYKKAAEAQSQQAEKIKKLEKALEEAKKEYGESAEEVQQLERELADANSEYDRQERQITSLSNKISKWNTDLNKTQTELVETDRALDETNDAIEHYDENIEEAGEETKKFGITMNSAGEGTEKLRISLGSLVSAQVVVDVLRNCAQAIKEVASAALEVGTKFESSMSKVAALSGASGDQLARLSEKAKEMGASTIYSASESADAFSYMALAGWKVEDMLEGIGPVLNLAASAQMDLAEASDIVTDYITAFGLKAEDAAHFSDAMATAMSTSNTTVQLLGESYKNVAATCGSMGIAMEDATAVLATMANAGVKGGEAGTALNAILTRLATNTKGAGDKLEEYGVKVYDASGKMNSISSILNGLADVWETLSQQEQAALAKTIAGTNQYSKFQTIMLGVSQAAKEGGMSFDDYAESLRNCEGAAEKMANTMQDNLAGDITMLKSALEGLGIATEGVFDDAFREAVQGATDSVSQLERAISKGDLGVSLSQLGDAIAEMTANLMDAAEDALPGFIDSLTWIVKNVDFIGAGITTLVSGLAAYKVATLAATIATEGFTVALNLNPYVLAATAVATLTVGLFKYSDAAQKAMEADTEATRATNQYLDAHRLLMDNLDDSAKKRQDEISTIDAQAAASRKLSDELFKETTSNERRAAIVAELKEVYPKLNIAVSEQGEVIGATKAQLDGYIESSMKMAKVEAAREHLTEIAKEQFEAEMELAEAKDKVAEKTQEVADAQAEATAEAQKHTDMNGELVEVYTREDEALRQAKEGLDNLTNAQSEAEQKVADLGEEYQRTMDYIGDNAPLDNAAASTEALGQSELEVVQITEELQKEFDELYESISKSVESSLDLTKKWTQDWGTSTSDMTTNIQSQIDGIKNWSENFGTLADNAEVQIDQRVLKYLADMGTDGAGLVQELVDTLQKSPEQLQGWSDKMAEYLTLEDSVAAEITDSYVTAVTDAMDGAAEAVTEGSSTITSATEEMANGLKSALEDSGVDAAFEETGKSLGDNLGKGISSSQSQVSDAANTVVEEAAKKADSKKQQFKDAGTNANKAVGEGIKSKTAEENAKEMAKGVYDAVASVLTAESGYEIGAKWMQGLADAINEKANAAIEAAAAAAAKAKDALNGGGGGDNNKGEKKEENKGGEKNKGGAKTNSMSTPNFTTLNNDSANRASLLSAGYSPLVDSISNLGSSLSRSMNNGTTQVNVELYGDAKDIFNVVRNQNTKQVSATGYNALA